MVANILRLRLLIRVNALRRSPWMVVGLAVALINVIVLITLALFSLVLARQIFEELWELIVVVGGTVLVSAWWILPLIAFGLDSTLAPARFAMFSIPRRQLRLGLGLSSLLGVPGFATAALLLVGLVVWLPDIAPFITGLVLSPVVFATCVVGARATTSLFAPLMERRGFRGIATLAALIPVLVLVPLFMRAVGEVRQGFDVAPQLISVLSWTPMGAAWGVSVDVSNGRWGLAAAHLAIALATLALLTWVWDRGLTRQLESSPRGVQSGGGRAYGLGWFRALPSTPMWAVAARCLTYWVRDIRYLGNLTVLPMMAITVIMLFRGHPVVVSLVVPAVVAFTIGWSIVADIAYDNTAFWLHVTSGVSGRDDRWGRVIAASVIGVPAILLSVLTTRLITERWDLAVVTAGLMIGIFLVSLGVSSVISARFIFAVPAPGDGPFTTPQGSAMATMVVQGLGSLAVMLMVIPVALSSAAAYRGVDYAVAATVGLGLLIGVTVLIAGVRWGAKLYESGTPELMHTLRSVN